MPYLYRLRKKAKKLKKKERNAMFYTVPVLKSRKYVADATCQNLYKSIGKTQKLVSSSPSSITSTITFLPIPKSSPNLRFFEITLDISSLPVVPNSSIRLSSEFDDCKNRVGRE